MFENKRALVEPVGQLNHLPRDSRIDVPASMLDPLTGLVGRDSAEAFLASQIAVSGVTIVLVNLVAFKKVNAEWGHICGDQILIAVGHRVSDELEAFEVVSRWDAARYLAISTHRGPEMLKLEAGIRDRLSRTYQVALGDEMISISVKASVGLAQTRGQEKVADLLERAEAHLR